MVLKLYYFDVRNLAEPIRLCLHYGNMNFEDVRIDPKDWPNWKDKFPYGKVSLLYWKKKKHNREKSWREKSSVFLLKVHY
jgi:hypothetical protein